MMNDMSYDNIVPEVVPPQPMLPQQQQQEAQYNLLYRRIQELQSTIQQSQTRNQQLQQQLVQTRQVIHNYTTTTRSKSDTTDADNDDDDDPTSLLQHLVFSSWNEPNNIRIDVVLPTLLQELQERTMQQEWHYLQSLLDELQVHYYQTYHVDSHHHDDDHDHETITTTSTTSGECTTSSSSHSIYATREQLQTFTQQIQDTIFLSQQPSLLLPLSFSSSVQTVQQYVRQTLQDTIHSRRATEKEDVDGHQYPIVVDANHEHPPPCLPSIDWIHDWINVGFDAIDRTHRTHLDLRHTLLLQPAMPAHQHPPHSKVDLSQVRLDIPSFVTTYQTQAALLQLVPPSSSLSSSTSNLRQYLDRPTLYESSIYIDVLLDALGGRNNALDDFMDQYIYNNPHLISASSSPPQQSTTYMIGPNIVAHMMNGLGHVPIPTTTYTKQTISNRISNLLSNINRQRTTNNNE